MDNNDRELYDKYDCMIARNGALIEWLCMRHAWGDTSRCAELRQECYISLWKYLPTLREETNVFQERAWVVLHCRSVFSHLAYRRRTHQFLPLDDSMADTIAEPDNSHLRDTIDTLAALLTSSRHTNAVPSTSWPTATAPRTWPESSASNTAARCCSATASSRNCEIVKL